MLLCGHRRSPNRTVFVRRALAELPAQEAQEQEQQHRRRRDLERSDEHFGVKATVRARDAQLEVEDSKNVIQSLACARNAKSSE